MDNMEVTILSMKTKIKKYKDKIEKMQNNTIDIQDYNKIIRENCLLRDQIKILMEREMDANQTIDKMDNIIYNLRK